MYVLPFSSKSVLLRSLSMVNYNIFRSSNSNPPRTTRHGALAPAGRGNTQTGRSSRLWSIGIGRDHNRDGQPNVHEVQDKDAAPCAADRELKRAINLGREVKWRKRWRHALLIVLAAVQRDRRAYAVGFRPRICEALLDSRQGSRLRFRSSSLQDGGARF